MGEYISLIIACGLFVGSHFLLSHILRGWTVTKFGEKAFLGIYSLIAILSFGWMIWAYSQSARGAYFWQPTDGVWIASSLLTLLAAIFYCGSMRGNPALANPDAVAGKAMATRPAEGLFRVTRHPMMWSFAFWGTAHILVAPRTDNFLFAGSIIFLALVGAWAQEGKKSAQMGAEWRDWQSRTSYWPRLSRLPQIGWRLWLAGVVLWLAATAAHNIFGPYNAGIFRWL